MISPLARDVAIWGPLRKIERLIRAPAMVAVAYYVGAESAFYIGTLSDRIFAPLWPPNTILFCTLLLVPSRRWWIFIAAAFPAHVVAEVGVGMPVPQYLIAFATNCTVAVLSAYGVLRWAPGPPWFASLRQALMYLLITVVVSPAISAFGGAFVEIAGGGDIKNYGMYWVHWYSANALAGAALGPVFLTWKDAYGKLLRLPHERKREAIFLILGLIGSCLMAFGASQKVGSSTFFLMLLFFPIPFVIWSALRFGAGGASGVIFIVAVFVIWGILRGSDPFTAHNAEENVMTLQLFLTTLAGTALPLGASIEELKRTRGEFQHLASELLRIQDGERRRISKELHERVSQDLAAAHLAVGRLGRTGGEPSFAGSLKELSESLRRSINDIRAVSHLLYPPLLDEGGLALALRSYVGRLSRRSGIDIDLAIPSEFGRFPAAIEFVLFKVIQEAVVNVHRHSGSSSTRITLAREGHGNAERIAVIIQDFSDVGEAYSGFTPPFGIAGSNEGGGAGLAEMHQRVRELGGSVHVQTAAGRTSVVVIVPTARNSSAQWVSSP